MHLQAADQPWHVLTHWIRKMEDELRTYVKNYILQHKDWFLSISKSYLKIKQQSAEDYIDYIGQPGSEIDILASFVLSRMYRFHFGLFFAQGVWCTSHNRDFKQVSMMLIFRGENMYSETCILNTTQDYLDSLIGNTQDNLMPSHNKEASVRWASYYKPAGCTEWLWHWNHRNFVFQSYQ